MIITNYDDFLIGMASGTALCFMVIMLQRYIITRNERKQQPVRYYPLDIPKIPNKQYPKPKIIPTAEPIIRYKFFHGQKAIITDGYFKNQKGVITDKKLMNGKIYYQLDNENLFNEWIEEKDLKNKSLF